MTTSKEKFLRRLFAAIGIFLIMFFSTASAFAAGHSGPVGPQGDIGPQGTVGPIGPVGTQGTVGPTGPTGPTDPGKDQTASPSDPHPTATISSEGDNSNSNSSNQDQNTPSSNNGSETNIDINNNSNTNNNVNINSNTGNNNIGENTAIGNITTGDSNSSVNILNLGNTTLLDGSSYSNQTFSGGVGDLVLTPDNCRTLLSNSITGPDSSNLNIFGNHNLFRIVSKNTATANNNININADTGNNNIDSNSVVGDLTTGAINVGVNTINLLNNTPIKLAIDTWNVMGDLIGNIIFPANETNNTTGPDSNNQNQISSSASTIVGNKNVTNASNNININTNTGGNDIGGNSVAGAISTGSSIVKTLAANITNAVATPIFYLINVFGEWTGTLDGVDPNSVAINQVNADTGPDSNNSNILTDDSQTIVNSENISTATNNITINANTGNNKVKNNTKVGNIGTGDIKVSANVVNLMNAFGQSVGSFTLRIINIFGNWHGNGTNHTTPPVDTVTPPAIIPPADGEKGSADSDSLPSAGTNGTVYDSSRETDNAVLAISQTRSDSTITTDGIPQILGTTTPEAGANTTSLFTKIMYILGSLLAATTIALTLRYAAIRRS